MKRQKLAHVSPWLLAAACALLTLIITVFAVNNYRREKKLMSEALIRQGLTIIRFVKASTRTSLRGNPTNIRMNLWQWTDHVQQAIDSSMEQPGLIFVGLIDQEGFILASSDGDEKKEKLAEDTFKYLRQQYHQGKASNNTFRIKRIANSTDSVFQIAAIFNPFGFKNYSPQKGGPGIVSRLRSDDIMRYRGRGNRRFMEQLNELSSKKYFLLVELDLKEFNKAVHRQFLQILFLSFVLLLVGFGGWLSLLTLQGLKGSQSRLRQIRQFTDILVSSLPVGLIATGDDDRIRIFNQSAEEMIGLSAAQVLGKEPDKILPEELACELDDKERKRDLIEQQEIRLPVKEGGERSLLVVALPVVDSEKNYAGNTLLMQDLSVIRELQREVRRNERLAALGKMAAGVAHELRNPLSSIKGLALLLKSKLKSDKAGIETADILVLEVERLNRSIGELLDYARPDKLQLEELDLSEVVAKSISLLSADLEMAKITLKKDITKDISVYADVDKLNQVLLNLLLNAVQAIGEQGVIIIRIFSDGENAVCHVEDNGQGLDQKYISRVFDPYFTTKSEGTGLGLAMSAKIIEAHKGSIEFSSKQDKGTSVKVKLPLYQGVN